MNYLRIFIWAIGAAIIGLSVATAILKKGKSMAIKVVGIIIGMGLLLLGSAIVFVPTGYTGVRITLGQVQSNPVPTGMTLKAPLIDTVKLVNNKLETKMMTGDAPIYSTIKGKVSIEIRNVTVNYRILPNRSVDIFREVSDPENILAFPIVESAIKTATSKLDADEVVVRSTSEAEAKEQLQAKLDAVYGKDMVSVQSIELGNIEFDEAFNRVIEEKNMAEQIQQKQAIENETNITKAEAEAKAKIAKAQGEADARIVEAQAVKEANELMEKSITEKILMQKYLEEWNGELPKVTTNDGSGVMFDVNSLMGNISEQSQVQATPAPSNDEEQGALEP